jgi:hypothetical protein
MFFTNCRINLVHDFGLHDVKNRQLKGNTRKRPCPCGVPMSDCLRIKFSAVGIRSTYNDYQVVLPVFFNNFFDTLLTLQVKCTSRCSNKTLGLHQQWFSSSTFHTFGYSLAHDSITFAQNNHFFPFQIHVQYPPVSR